MHLTRRVLLAAGWLLAAAALFLLVADLFVRAATGWDMTDVAGVVDGCAVDWPTGERPVWALVPAFSYSAPLLLMGATVIAFTRKIGLRSIERTSRGTA